MFDKILFLIFLITPFHSSAFNSKFYWTKWKMESIFDLKYDEEIRFGKVIWIDSWEGLEEVCKVCDNDVLAVFENMFDYKINDIYFLKKFIRSENPLLDNNYFKSVLVHEYAHFFTKKAGWNPKDILEDEHLYNVALIEAIAYYVQHLWLIEETG